jgi:hypothetical protein
VDQRSGIPSILYEHRSTNGSTRFIKAKTASGGDWFAPVDLVDTYMDGINRSPSLHFDTNRWYASWHQGSDVDYYKIRFYESLDDGISWSPSMVYVNDSWYMTSAYYATVSASEGDVLISWIDSRNGSSEVFIEHGTHR